MEFLTVLSFVSASLLTLIFLWPHIASFLDNRLGKPEKKSNQATRRSFVQLDQCRAILACRDHDTIGKNSLGALASRANPNQRLVRAFGIDSAFTTVDDKWRKEFRNDATKIMTGLELVDWKRIAEFAKTLVHEREIGLAYGGSEDRFELDNFVRTLSLKITLHVFFKLSPEQLNDFGVEHAIEQTTSCINTLWIESKTSIEVSKEKKQKLWEALDSITDMGSKPRKNPLNFILPAYETLWRVVLSCFIEVTFRKGAQQMWRDELGHFLDDPTGASFENASSDSPPTSVAVKFIVNEALRLYPSTKSVYRELKTEGNETPELVVADIEQCQRLPEIWGLEPERFMPARWEAFTQETQRSLMTFGAGGFVCPAKPKYGPFMIAILVAALATNISPEKWILKLYRDGSEVGRELGDGEALMSDRKTYDKMEIAIRS